MKKRIRIQGMLITFVIIITFVLCNFAFPSWKNEKWDEFLDAVGIAIILSGFLFRISARGYKEEESLSSHKLVKDGPYALIKDPMYFGTFLIGMGFVIVLFNWWALLLFLCPFFLIYIPQIRKEKAILSKQFGEEYRNYCRETPVYFPRISYLLSIRKYLPLKLSWIKKELSSLIASIVCLMAIEIVQDIRLFGKKELLTEALELILTAVIFICIILLVFRVKE
jgi:protein-S-isoprenylcysteine O-methyltransferase Ste14